VREWMEREGGKDYRGELELERAGTDLWVGRESKM